MDHQQFRQLREKWGIPIPWLAKQTGIKAQQIDQAQEGEQPVPAKAAAILSELDNQLSYTVDDALESILSQFGKDKANAPQISLVTYPNDQILWHYRPDMHPLSVWTHAAMMVNLQMQLERHGMRVVRVKLDPEDYERWRGDRPDNEMTRGAWAATKVTDPRIYL